MTDNQWTIKVKIVSCLPTRARSHVTDEGSIYRQNVANPQGHLAMLLFKLALRYR